MARTTNVEKVFPRRGPWRVRDFTLAEIRRLDAGSWFGRRFRGERVPTLAQALRAMEDGGLHVMIEVKRPDLYPGIGRRIRARLNHERHWVTAGRVRVHSFDWTFVRDFHGLMPRVPTAVLGTPAVNRMPAVRRYARFLHVPARDVTSSYVRAAHRAGLGVYAWTVDDAAVMRRMLASGADGVITNRPDRLRDVLAAR